MKWDLDDLAGVSDLAEEYAVRNSTVVNWAARYPGFPHPLTFVGRRPVYSRRQVDRWWRAKDWKQGKH